MRLATSVEGAAVSPVLETFNQLPPPRHITLESYAMFIAMNRFKIALGKEEEFVDIWRQRDSHLEGVSGFREFHLLQGEKTAEYALFASHTVWESRQAFEAWTHSESFRRAHANAGTAKGVYLGPPQLELFEAAL